MRKLSLMALAASAALVPVASAQTVPDPDPYYGLPGLRLNLPSAAAVAATPPAVRPAPGRNPLPPAAHSGHEAPPADIWRPALPPATQVRHEPRPQQFAQREATPPPVVRMMRREAAPVPHHAGRDVRVMRHDGRQMRHHAPQMQHRGPPGRRFTHIRRIDRGAMVPHFWFGPQFHVRHWGMHGFPQPMHGRRWIRYYDDALLIDRDGRVHDGRYGWDWDRDGDRWSYDDRGIPVYVGDGDFEPGERDYEWAEDYEERGDRDDYAYDRGPPPRPHGYGYGYGYGYGAYGYSCGCGPVVVTETTTTTAPVVETRTYYEYVTEEVRAAPRRHVRKPVRRAPPPPRPGERG